MNTEKFAMGDINERYPYFTWQHEFQERWITYSCEECVSINEALFRGQKTLTLTTSDKKKIRINLEQMFQKHLHSGYEQPVRCLVYNDNSYLCWSWEDEDSDIVSYTAFIALFLETAYHKKLAKVDIFFKGDYEIDLQQLTQRNKSNGNILNILRDKINYGSVVVSKDNIESEAIKLKWSLASQSFIQKMAAMNEQSIKQIYMGLPIEPDMKVDINLELNVGAIDFSAEVSKQFVAVHSLCPIARKSHVYSEGSTVFQSMLSLTNLQDNSNKLYSMQLLGYGKKTQYAIWSWWGRVGLDKRNTELIHFKDLNEAKSKFDAIFYEKTGNHFGNKVFERVKGKYDCLDASSSSTLPKKRNTPQLKLNKKVQSLLEFICDPKQIDEAAMDTLYDTKVPIACLTSARILEGYTALKNIAELIKKEGVGKELLEACNIFYEKIPHDFGRKSPPIIYTLSDVKEKLRMLETLSGISLSMSVMKASKSTDDCENMFAAYYNYIDCDLVPLYRISEEFQLLNTCLQNTQGPTHSYSLEIIEAYKCFKDSQFLDFGNSRLLWHGSRVSNWMGILKGGLKIAPREAPASGYMFGKGIYFADCCSKSANYCMATKRKNEGVLLMSEVSLGVPLQLQHANHINSTPQGYHSVFGTGKFTPQKFEKAPLLSARACLPCGPLLKRNLQTCLNYNEYVVYDVRQVQMKYLLRIKFNF